MKISTQIKLVKAMGISGSIFLAGMGVVSLTTIATTAAFFGKFAILVFLQVAVMFFFSAGVLALTNLGCKLLERAFKNDLELEVSASLES